MVSSYLLSLNPFYLSSTSDKADVVRLWINETHTIEREKNGRSEYKERKDASTITTQ